MLLWLPVVLTGFALLWACACMFLAPYKDIRYIMSAFPIMILLVPWLVNFFFGWKRFMLVAAMIAIFTVCAVKATPVGYFTMVEKPLESPISRVAHVFPGEKNLLLRCVEANPEMPIIIAFAKNRAWTFMEILPEIPGKRMYELVFSADDLKKTLNKYKKALFFNEKTSQIKVPEGYLSAKAGLNKRRDFQIDVLEKISLPKTH